MPISPLENFDDHQAISLSGAQFIVNLYQKEMAEKGQFVDCHFRDVPDASNSKSNPLTEFIAEIHKPENLPTDSSRRYQLLLSYSKDGHFLAVDFKVSPDGSIDMFILDAANYRTERVFNTLAELQANANINVYFAAPTADDLRVQTGWHTCFMFALEHFRAVAQMDPYAELAQRAEATTKSGLSYNVVEWTELPPVFIFNTDSRRFAQRYVDLNPALALSTPIVDDNGRPTTQAFQWPEPSNAQTNTANPSVPVKNSFVDYVQRTSVKPADLVATASGSLFPNLPDGINVRGKEVMAATRQERATLGRAQENNYSEEKPIISNNQLEGVKKRQRVSSSFNNIAQAAEAVTPAVKEVSELVHMAKDIIAGNGVYKPHQVEMLLEEIQFEGSAHNIDYKELQAAAATMLNNPKIAGNPTAKNLCEVLAKATPEEFCNHLRNLPRPQVNQTTEVDHAMRPGKSSP